MRRTNRIYGIIVSLFFLIWITIPFLNDIFIISNEPQVSKTENRNLASKPEFRIDHLDPFPGKYEKYFQDHFILRQKEVKLHSYLSFHFFNRSPLPDQVDIGKENWLFYAGDDRNIYQGKIMLPDDKINEIVNLLHKRTLYCRNKGIHFYVCFAPISQEIYPEYLPNNYFRSQHGTQTDKIISAILKDTIIQFIDLKSTLLEAKKFGCLYKKTDNHWNFRGGYFAYLKIIQRIRKDFPILHPIPYSDVNFKPVIGQGGTLASTIGLNDVFMETQLELTVRNSKARRLQKKGYPPPYWFAYKSEYEIETSVPDQKLPKIFVIRDSFFSFPMRFMQENFSKMTVIWDAWMYGANKPLIEKEKPDIVLLMIYEPHIPKILVVPSD